MSRKFLSNCCKDYYKSIGRSPSNDKYQRHRKLLKDRNKFEYYDDFFKTHFDGKNVVDIGCALGFFSVWIGLYADSVMGIEHNIKTVESANRFVSLSGLSNVSIKHFSALDITDNFLNDNKIDSFFWHKTGLGPNNMLMWNTILNFDNTDTIICNFFPVLSFEYLKEKWNYDVIEKDKENKHKKSKVGKMYVIKRGKLE